MAWILLASLAAAAQAPASANTSVYTDLDLRGCRVLERIAEGSSVRWRCPGHAGIPLFISSGDDRYDLDAGIDNGEWESLSPFNVVGSRVEWRLRRGRPLAIIYRFLVARSDIGPAYSRLAVETIGRRGRPGCVIAWIDGGLPTANADARAVADRRAERFRCGADRAEGQPD
ncbi:MAG: hypothetical protein QOD42_3228 [Sphingomonadales bacterium]|jgi:hypothetical protein|nr:hypothetical protein [Sphingomonadales bacterium]